MVADAQGVSPASRVGIRLRRAGLGSLADGGRGGIERRPLLGSVARVGLRRLGGDSAPGAGDAGHLAGSRKSQRHLGPAHQLTLVGVLHLPG